MKAPQKKSAFRLWIWFYVAFALLFLAWYFLLKTAIQHQPKSIPLPTEPSVQETPRSP